MKKFLALVLTGLFMTTTACGNFPENQVNTDIVSVSSTGEQKMNTDTTVGEVIANPAFEDFGRLLFHVDRTVTDDMVFLVLGIILRSVGKSKETVSEKTEK